MPTLIWRNGPNGPDEHIPLTRRITSIGSSHRNDVVLDARGVEDNHALIQFDGQQFFLQRLGHQAKCQVNGKKARRTGLDHHDTITFGDAILEFLLFDTPKTNNADEEKKRPSQDFEALLQFSQKLLEAHDIDALLEKLMDAIIEITHAEKGFLLLVDDDDELQVRVARAIDRKSLLDDAKLYSDSIIQAVIERRKTLIVSDALKDATFHASQSVVNFQLCSVMCAPLLHQGKLLGLIYVGNDSVANLFRDEHRDTLTIFSTHAALIVQNAMLMDRLQQDNRVLRKRLETIHFGSIVGASDGMRALFHQIERIAPTDVSVLIDGETGTGKELIAHEIHARSHRAQGPFVSINCGAIPESLLESELFGHARGAFTGAHAARNGRFQAASGGTLFLDEIGEMPLHLQVKILRALQEHTITRIGDHREEPIDIRILAATNRDLEREVQAGTFREDLYYRLNVIQLTLPPLRNRGEDILLIAQYLLERYLSEYGIGARQFGAEAKSAMLRYRWPGNIRELDNHIKKAVILAEGRTLTAEDLALSAADPPTTEPLQSARETWQRTYIRDAVIRCNGNRTQAAKALGVDPRTIYRYLKNEEIEDNG